MASSEFTEVFALLSDRTVREIRAEIIDPKPSEHPVARVIVDKELGWANLGFVHPQGPIQERTLRLSGVKDPVRALNVLRQTPGVLDVSLNRLALNC